MDPPEEVRERLELCGQGHLLQFWAELDTAQRRALLAALPPGLGEHCRLAAAAGARQRGPPERLDGRMEPLPAELMGSARRSGPAALQRWEAEGERGSRPPVPSVPGLRGFGPGVRGSRVPPSPSRCGAGTAACGDTAPCRAVHPRRCVLPRLVAGGWEPQGPWVGREGESGVTATPRPISAGSQCPRPGEFWVRHRVFTLS